MTTLVDNKAKIVRILDERFYQNNKPKNHGLWLPGSSEILQVYPKGFGFEQWLKNTGHNADEVKRRAAEEGKIVHDMLEKFFLGFEIFWTDPDNPETAAYTPEAWRSFCRFLDFVKTWEPQTQLIETSLVSDKLGHGGTLDWKGKIGPDKWLIDYKNTNHVFPSHELQVASYKRLLESVTRHKVDRVGILHLKSQVRTDSVTNHTKGVIAGKGWKLHEVTDLETKLEIFDHTKAIWNYDHSKPDGKGGRISTFLPRNFDYPMSASLEGIKTEARKAKKKKPTEKPTKKKQAKNRQLSIDES